VKHFSSVNMTASPAIRWRKPIWVEAEVVC